MDKFKISSDFITLGQFLKTTNHIGSGGQAKFFLLSNDVMVNQEKKTERGKKLYPGDYVTVDGMEYMIIHDKKSNT